MFNFAWLAEITTGRKRLLWGIIPPLKTILALFALSIVIASGMWLWTSFWTGVYGSFASFIPMVGPALAATLGLTFLNFWFSRDINAAMLSTRDIRDDVTYGPTNPVDVTKMVNHLVHEVNAYFNKQLGDKHQDMPVPVLLTYTDDGNFKIVTIEGRNPGKSALIFSSGAFDMTRMNQRQLGALIEKELVKIYLRRGPLRTFVGMLSDLATTLQNLSAPENAWYYRFLGILTGPLQWVLLLRLSISRSYEYEASEHVVKMGRGPDLVDAMDRKVCRTQTVFPLKSTLKKNQNLHKRDPYQGHGPIKSFADWVDQYEYPRADKTGWRWLSFLDCVVNYAMYYINECWNQYPRSTNEKSYILGLIKATLSNGKEVSFDSDDVSEGEKHRFYEQHREINRALHDDIVKRIGEERKFWKGRAKQRNLYDSSVKERFQPYHVIGPNGNGWVQPNHDPGLFTTIESQLLEERKNFQAQLLVMQAEIARMKAELQVNKAKGHQISVVGSGYTTYRDTQQQQAANSANQPPPERGEIPNQLKF